MTEVEAFMTEQLRLHGIAFEVRRNFIHVLCPYHQHSGRKRHLGFSRTTGGMHCWACRRKGHWNQYARRHGLETFEHHDAKLHDFVAMRQAVASLTTSTTPRQPDWLLRWSLPEWRGLSGDFLAAVPSYEWYDEDSGGHRILWPVYCNGTFRGCTSARLDDAIEPKTRNLPGLDAGRVLWPLDHPAVVDAKAVVLVEGQFDALRLLSRGTPAVSILGVGTWHRRKLQWLSRRGVLRVVLAFDGDVAGQEITETVQHDAAQTFDVTTIEMPDGQDPGDCSDDVVRKIVEAVNANPNC